jgi:ubiquinone/menaquinone biosynthesis C-methylase UbiE
LLREVPEGTVDFVTMVFVLSAISPSQMHSALLNIARLLKPGKGKVLFRDYARGDLAQDKHQVCLFRVYG